MSNTKKDVADLRNKENLRKQLQLMSIASNTQPKNAPIFKTPEMIAEEFKEIYIKSKNIELNLNAIIALIPSIIFFIEKMHNTLKGPEKQQLALNIIKYLYVKEIENEEDRKTLERLLNDENLKMMINSIVYIGHDLTTFVHKQVKKRCKFFC